MVYGGEGGVYFGVCVLMRLDQNNNFDVSWWYAFKKLLTWGEGGEAGIGNHHHHLSIFGVSVENKNKTKGGYEKNYEPQT